jgi:hypothetical protein
MSFEPLTRAGLFPTRITKPSFPGFVWGRSIDRSKIGRGPGFAASRMTDQRRKALGRRLTDSRFLQTSRLLMGETLARRPTTPTLQCCAGGEFPGRHRADTDRQPKNWDAQWECVSADRSESDFRKADDPGRVACVRQLNDPVSGSIGDKDGSGSDGAELNAR